MSKLSCSNYHGCGNTFTIVDGRNLHLDGLVVLLPDSSADFRIRIFNRDGSEAPSCGNALRCAARFLADSGLPQKKYRIAVGDRIVEADYVGDQISIQMGIPKDLKLHALPEIHYVDTGSPHAVVFVDDVDAVDVEAEGKRLRHHPQFHPFGTNVNFASLLPNGGMRVRTYERGVEGETDACGTGAAAVAVIASYLYEMIGPQQLHFKGGVIEIHYDGQMTMIGPAEKM